MASAENNEGSSAEQPAINNQDNQDPSALVVTQIEHARRVATRSPVVWPEEEEYAVYLCGYASSDSFVGPAEDEDCMTDDELADFIWKSNPDMFRRLLRKDAPAHRGYPHGTGAITHIHNTLEIVPKHNDLWSTLLQLKRVLVYSLLNGHILVLQRMAISHTTCCSHPCCQSTYTPMPRGNFSLELRLEGTLEARSFCLHCIEHTFCQPPDEQKFPPVSLDGIMEDMLGAAQRLAAHVPLTRSPFTATPKLVKDLHMRQRGLVDIQNYFEPDFPFNHPSNSAKALSLRRRRDVEIEEILSDVEKYNKRRQDEINVPQKPPLVITQPLQMPGEERYKKQGLSKYDMEKERKISGKRDTKSGGSIASIEASSRFLTPRTCRCSEPAGVDVIIRCGAEFCPIGVYHLECTGLSEKPGAQFTWYCSNCSDGLKETLITADASDADVGLPGDDSNYSYDYDCDTELDTEDHGSDNASCSSSRISVASYNSAEFSKMVKTQAEPIEASPILRTRVNSGPATPLPTTPPRANETPPIAFTPVNLGRTPRIPTPFSKGLAADFAFDGSPTSAESQSTQALPVGWSEATFEDLAPFIIAETNLASLHALAPEHTCTLEDWRALCPPSRLLPAQRRNCSNDDYRAQIPGEVMPLSYLLDRVDVQMAGQ